MQNKISQSRLGAISRKCIQSQEIKSIKMEITGPNINSLVFFLPVSLLLLRDCLLRRVLSDIGHLITLSFFIKKM